MVSEIKRKQIKLKNREKEANTNWKFYQTVSMQIVTNTPYQYDLFELQQNDFNSTNESEKSVFYAHTVPILIHHVITKLKSN